MMLKNFDRSYYGNVRAPITFASTLSYFYQVLLVRQHVQGGPKHPLQISIQTLRAEREVFWSHPVLCVHTCRVLCTEQRLRSL